MSAKRAAKPRWRSFEKSRVFVRTLGLKSRDDWQTYCRSGDKPDNTLLITTGEIDWLAQSFSGKWQRAPTPEELTGLVKAHIREQVLYREAMAMGLDPAGVFGL